MIAKVIPESSRILDIHKGKHAIKLSDVSLTNDDKTALIGFHSFTGNDIPLVKKSKLAGN